MPAVQRPSGRIGEWGEYGRKLLRSGTPQRVCIAHARWKSYDACAARVRRYRHCAYDLQIQTSSRRDPPRFGVCGGGRVMRTLLVSVDRREWRTHTARCTSGTSAFHPAGTECRAVAADPAPSAGPVARVHVSRGSEDATQCPDSTTRETGNSTEAVATDTGEARQGTRCTSEHARA